MNRLVENLESRRLFHAAISVAVNFQPLLARKVPGYQTEYGLEYGVRKGGISYGWSEDSRQNVVDRGLVDDQKLDTLAFMQAGGDREWEIGVENGLYDVYVVAGDPKIYNQRMGVTVEGQAGAAGITRKNKRFVDGLVRVNVTDGRLTIGNSADATDNKICYLGIVSAEETATPTLTIDTPQPTAKEDGQVAGSFRVTRAGNDTAAVTVPLTVGGSATNGTDYGRFGTSVSFAAGQTEITLPVRPVADGVNEGDETVTLTLGTVSGYTNVESTATVTILDTATSSPAVTNIAWASKASRPVAASEIFGGAVGSKLYTFGGFVDNTFKPSRAAYAYDVTGNSWTRLADLPVGLTHTGVAVDGTNIYFAGGYPGTGTNGNQQFATTAVYRYDTTTDSYTALPGLPAARGGGALAKLGDYLYFLGGTSGVTDTSRTDVKTVWRLDLSNTSAGWSQRADIPAARNHPAAVVLNGNLYFMAGQTSQDQTLTTKSDLWRYNASANTWTTLASLPGGRSHTTDATFAYGGRIVMIAGQSAYESPLASVLSYNPDTNKWSTLNSLPAARFSGVGHVVGGKFVYTGGYNGGFKANTYVGTLS